MKVKITCSCGASFDIKDGIQHPKEICCPNCGKQLPDNASSDLLKMFDAFKSLQDKLVYFSPGSLDDPYSLEISHNI